ncbi:hypothetical protein [Erwinia amylovora]|uniref:hypothetical protein n=1 Tax=Erwinia amylovora TaxID=552 RepID=UPI001444635E|nr:hypothetical protein [Erwinia amylovora]
MSWLSFESPLHSGERCQVSGKAQGRFAEPGMLAIVTADDAELRDGDKCRSQ